ncbi:MAG: ATP-binding cassette domain-containing protein [Microscillaceae bacterium]
MTEPQPTPILSARKLYVYQGLKPVLREVSFDMHKGEFVYLIGRTGSGKSSLLKTLYADLPLRQGEVQVADFALHQLKRAQVPWLRRKLGIVFQDFQLFYDRTVNENLLFVMRATGWAERSKMKDRLAEVLLQVRLSGAGHKMPHQLSGGEQQRLGIARALINEPMLLLADEPTGNLDPEVSEEILELFLKINRRGTAILMATHDRLLLEKYPQRTLVCHNGFLRSENFLSNPSG